MRISDAPSPQYGTPYVILDDNENPNIPDLIAFARAGGAIFMEEGIYECIVVDQDVPVRCVGPEIFDVAALLEQVAAGRPSWNSKAVA